MKNLFHLILLVILSCSISDGIAQNETIHIHSISNDRMPGGDGDVGYTLDGLRMIGARAKLLNPANFSPTGTYSKQIEITDDFEVESISSIPDIDLFYFGTFNKNNTSLIPFEDTEIDSLFEWSIRGGKLIIGAAAVAEIYNYQPDILNIKWGFDITFVGVSDYIPVVASSTISIFDGPFGEITTALQGGAVQGYFNLLPEDKIVLAEDLEGNPTMYLDCYTLDLVLADGDGHNDLGGVTSGPAITSDNDIFWSNTIAYMDALQDPPVIEQNGNVLTTGVYSSYQWLLNGVLIQGANSNTYTMTEEGTYSVQVSLDCGCIKEAFFETSVAAENPTLEPEIKITPNPTSGEITISMETALHDGSIEIMNSTGQLISRLRQLSGSFFKIDLSSQPAGLYILHVIEDQKTKASHKIVLN
jgi:hypothetical protein